MFLKLLGIIITFGSLTIVYLFETAGSLPGHWRIFHWPAMTLTGFGPMGLVLLCTDGRTIKKTFSLLFGLSPVALADKHDKALFELQQIVQDIYTKGAKSLETLDVKKFSPLFQRTIDRLTLRMPTSDIRELVFHERHRAEMRLAQSVEMLGLPVKLCPSIGMLGTILGMTQLLASLQDPSQIGAHMSLALLTTFFGLFFSIVIWTPIQARLQRLLQVELHVYDQVMHFLELLEKRKPAQYYSTLSDAGMRQLMDQTGSKKK